jgi:hypothetical protein
MEVGPRRPDVKAVGGLTEAIDPDAIASGEPIVWALPFSNEAASVRGVYPVSNE